MRVSIRNFEFVNGVLSFDMDSVGNNPPTPPPPNPPPTPPGRPLRDGYDSDPAVAFNMFLTAMDENKLTPIGVQGHGDQIVAAMKKSYPDWDVYLSVQDSPVAPGFGSIDCTISSGEGGWEWRPDGAHKWFPKDQRWRNEKKG